MKYTYYPGCSLESSSSFYDSSGRLSCERLDVELEELEDWNCCGATSYVSVDEELAFSISARNLALAEKHNRDLVASCSACYCILKKTNEYMKEDPRLAEDIDECLAEADLEYNRSVRVRHLLDVVVNDVSRNLIRDRMERDLEGLNIAPYYGCQIVRPTEDFDNQEFPTSMDHLMEDLGAEVTYFPHKTKCCGGSLTFNASDVAYNLMKGIFTSAKRGGADAIVTTCPLCQTNLDLYQEDVNREYGTDFNIPILFFTQLMGFTLGYSSEEMEFGKTIVSADSVLNKIA